MLNVILPGKPIKINHNMPLSDEKSNLIINKLLYIVYHNYYKTLLKLSPKFTLHPNVLN